MVDPQILRPLLVLLLVLIGVSGVVAAAAAIAYAYHLSGRAGPSPALIVVSKELENLRGLIEVVGLVLLSLSVVSSAVALMWSDWQRREDDRADAYADLAYRYDELLRDCMAEPFLDCYDRPMPKTDLRAMRPSGLGPEERMKQRIMASRIINHLEQWFHRFRQNKDTTDGWKVYVRGYLEREWFRREWYAVHGEWSQQFQCFMNEELRTLGHKPPESTGFRCREKGTVVEVVVDQVRATP